MNNNFPLYAYYRGDKSKVFKDGDIIKLYSLNNLSSSKYCPMKDKGSVYKSPEVMEEGYAEYISLDLRHHEKVHITEVEEWR